VRQADSEDREDVPKVAGREQRRQETGQGVVGEEDAGGVLLVVARIHGT